MEYDRPAPYEYKNLHHFTTEECSELEEATLGLAGLALLAMSAPILIPIGAYEYFYGDHDGPLY